MSKWIDDVFKAASVAKGNIVRRKRTTVEKYASVEELIQEAKRRGFHVVETGDQIVVMCNSGLFKVVC